jgi:hypothetical protein
MISRSGILCARSIEAAECRKSWNLPAIWQRCIGQHPLEIVAKKFPFNRCSIRHRKHKPMILPCRSDRQSVGRLPCALGDERLDLRLRQGDRAPAALRLTPDKPELAFDPLQRLIHR